MTGDGLDVEGLMIDIAGVLTLGGEPIPGALAALDKLRSSQIPLRFMTNSTIYCRYTLHDLLRSKGFGIEMHELFTATYAAADYLRSKEAKSFYPLLLPDAQQEFSGIDVVEEEPEFVVVGDMGASFSFARLNTAFRAVINGAQLVALHKKRIWRTQDGLFMDAGAFVVALEYASEVSAFVVGKPSAAYFGMVLDDMGLPASSVAVIGDDVEADVRGAQQVGAKGWLVKTGRFRRGDLGRGIWPDRIFDSFEHLVERFTESRS